MKSFVNIALIIAAQILLSACTINRLDSQYACLPLVFDVAVSPNTKQQSKDCQIYPDNLPFGIWAYDESRISYLNNSKVVNSDGAWIAQGVELWPNDVLSFLAYSPYGRASSFSEKGIVFKDYDISEGLDLMYTVPLENLAEDNMHGVVPIQFRRALSLVRFRVRANMPEYCYVKLKSISLGSVHSCGDFSSLPSPGWELGDQQRDFEVFQGEMQIGDLSVPVGQELYMIPQNSSITVSVVCDIITGDVILADQKISTVFDMVWRPGKIEAYELKLDGRLNLSVDHDNS